MKKSGGMQSPFTGKGVIYSAIIGDYDAVKEPEYKNPESNYILFTDNPDVVSNVWDVRLIHRKEGYPEHNGLFEGAFWIRELKNPRVIKVMETWWQEVANGNKRDQLSFNYACWKNNFVYDTTDFL